MKTTTDRARIALAAGAVCAVAATAALIFSWSITGQARLVAGIASGVLGPAGVWFGGIWYRARQRERGPAT